MQIGCAPAHWGTINIVIPSEDQVSKNSSIAHRNSGRSAKEHEVQENICLIGLFKVCICSLILHLTLTSLFCSSEGNKVEAPVFLYLFDLLDSLLHYRGPTAITFSPYLWSLSSTWVFSVPYKREILELFPQWGHCCSHFRWNLISTKLKETSYFWNYLILYRFHREAITGQKTQ